MFLDSATGCRVHAITLKQNRTDMFDVLVQRNRGPVPFGSLANRIIHPEHKLLISDHFCLHVWFGLPRNADDDCLDLILRSPRAVQARVRQQAAALYG